MNDEAAGLRTLTSEIVSAYLSHNSVNQNTLPDMISAVYAALTGLSEPAPAPVAEKPEPPVSIKKSLQRDYLISMEDGQRYKSLKRHLARRGLTPDQYREKWGLPRDYPMVCPAYSEARSSLAKSMGFGGRKREVPEVVEAQPARKLRKKVGMGEVSQGG